jgi:hypothetical protein
MASLTWTEFKASVDRQLAKQNISPDTQIWYIDVSFPGEESHNKVEVSVDDILGIAI